jgi:D-glycero-alpha-D-manno-heptose 1-phosphate guanylyltransferase
LGTGGAIFQSIKNSFFNKFLVINGDTCFNIDLKEFTTNWESGTIKMAVKEMSNCSRYGTLTFDVSGKVQSFREKDLSSTSSSGFINGGIYLLDRSILNFRMSEEPFFSLENDVFPLLLREGKIYSQVYNDEFIDIGIPEDYSRAQTLIRKWLER